MANQKITELTELTAVDSADSTVTVCATPCVLGHITINTTSAHALTVRDAGGNNGADNTVATIAASPVIGSVFRYDVDLKDGLKITVPSGYVGDATIAFLPQ